jgi:PilZ domain
MPLPKPEAFADQRQSPRHTLARLAKIQPTDSGPWRYCLVSDMSDGGIRLHAPGFAVTDEFTLSLDHPDNDGTYQVVWRLRDDVGAKLMEPATPKPD